MPKPLDRRIRNREYDAARRNTLPWRAWYNTARWQAIRSNQLRTHPLCAMCDQRGITSAATVCDHVAPHRGNADLFWTGPFQSLCKACHDTDKARIERGGTMRRDVDATGWPPDSQGVVKTLARFD